MGHIKLASRLATCGTSRASRAAWPSPRHVTAHLEKILYFANYIVTDVHEEARKDMLASLNMDKDERAIGCALTSTPKQGAPGR